MAILFSIRKSSWWLLVILSALILISTINPIAYECGDVVFLYNRATQMIKCLSDGNIPWFYYADFGGAGYGTPFFYGQLLLYLFLPFVSMGIWSFTNIVILTSILLIFYASERFVSRFSSDSYFIAFVYTFGVYSCMHYVLNFLIWCNIGVAVAILFFAECISYFRDNKGYLRPALLYFILLNTHTLSALWGFVGCVALFLYYKGWQRDWYKFFLVTVVLCLYTLANIFYHSGVLTRLDSINASMLENGSIGRFCASILPFGGYIYKSMTGSYAGYSICDFVTLVFLILGFRKSNHKILLLICWAGLMIGIHPIWESLMRVYKFKSQFPVRFAPFLLLVIYTLCLNSLGRRYKILLGVVLIPSMMFGLASKMSIDIPKTELYLIGQGEYLPVEFNIDYYNSILTDKRFSISGDACYGQGGGVYPKIYYNGYEATTLSGERLSVSAGECGFCYVSAELDDDIVLKYIHPWWLQLLGVFSYTCFIIGGLYDWKRALCLFKGFKKEDCR